MYIDQFCLILTMRCFQVIEQLNEKIIFSDELTDKQKTMIGDVLGVSSLFYM